MGSNRKFLGASAYAVPFFCDIAYDFGLVELAVFLETEVGQEGLAITTTWRLAGADVLGEDFRGQAAALR